MAKRPKYRLQVVLERKEEARDQAALYLGECRAELKREQEEENRLHEELSQNRNRRREAYETLAQKGLSGGLDVHEAQQHLNFVKFLDVKAKELEGEIEMQKERVRKAEEKVQEALRDLIRASRELQVMQKHKAKWEAKVNKEEEAAQEKEMNEIGNVLYELNVRTKGGAYVQ